jgi:hypothetical protein
MRGEGGGEPQPDLLGQPLVRGRDLARDPLHLAAVHRVLLLHAPPVLLLPRRIRYLITVLSAMGPVRIHAAPARTPAPRAYTMAAR